MKKQYFNLSILILFIAPFLTQSQSLEWASAMGGTSPNEGYNIAVDFNGNVYTTGRYQGTVDFDPGAAVFNLTSNGLADIFITKQDSQGNFIWAKSIGGSFSDEGYGISTDSSGNIYLTGIYALNVDFDPGAGVFNLNSTNEGDTFILKLDTNGNFIWAKAYGGSFSSGGNVDPAYSIHVDNLNNAYITGRYRGTVDFDPGTGTADLTAVGDNDIFILKVDSAGNTVWARGLGGSENDKANSVTVDSNGNVYATGEFRDTVDFDPGTGTVNLDSTGVTDAFVLALDSSGNFLWAKSFGRSSSSEEGFGIAVDDSNNVYSTGRYSGRVDFDPSADVNEIISRSGSFDIYLQKLDANGNFLWAKSFGSSGNEEVFDIVCDTDGAVYTTGFFAGRADFDPSTAEFFINDQGIQDIFIHKLDTNGDFEWVVPIGSTLINQGRGLAVDNSNNIYATGLFSGTTSFERGSSNNSDLTSAGQNDIFVMKLSQPTSSVSDTFNTSFSVFPNPTNGKFKIKSSHNQGKTGLTISVWNNLGQEIYSEKNINSLEQEFSLDDSSGVYFVKIQSEEFSKVLKIIKY